MKLIGRILILLVAAAVVIGVTYAISQTTAARSVVGGRGGFGGDPNHAPGNFGGRGNGQGNFQGGFDRGPRGGDFERGFGGVSWVVVLRNLGLMAGVILMVQLVRIGWRKLKSVNSSASTSA
ncbi:MAG: hypothetical protein U0559_08870 [Anaerolineae bacterium]